jgi:toxin-antitoxin system PIN domain toxin
VSFTVDVNVLLYASDASSRFHGPARDLLDRLSRGPEIVYVFWPVIMGYLRIATHPAVFDTPLIPNEALANVDGLLSLPHVQAPGEGERFWPRYRDVAEEAAARGNLIPDAHVVALMEENGVRTIWTHDRDFRRFAGIEARDPFE